MKKSAIDNRSTLLSSCLTEPLKIPGIYTSAFAEQSSALTSLHGSFIDLIFAVDD